MYRLSPEFVSGTLRFRFQGPIGQYKSELLVVTSLQKLRKVSGSLSRGTYGQQSRFNYVQ